eukprot:s4638_g1.t1
MQLVRKLHFTDEAVDFSTFNGSAADTACAWVRMHRHVWKDWLPNATLCNPGYGLVDQNSSFAVHAILGAIRRPTRLRGFAAHAQQADTNRALRRRFACLAPWALWRTRRVQISAIFARWATTQIVRARRAATPAPTSEWIPTQGAVSSSFCSCTDGFALHSGSCHRCLPGTRCRNNEVRLEPGYWSPSSSPFLVFRCSVADRCPGGEPGCCREGRDPDSVDPRRNQKAL